MNLFQIIRARAVAMEHELVLWSTSWCLGARAGALEHELVLWSMSWCFGARAGALEHELVLFTIMSKIIPTEKNIVCDMAA